MKNKDIEIKYLPLNESFKGLLTEIAYRGFSSFVVNWYCSGDKASIPKNWNGKVWSCTDLKSLKVLEAPHEGKWLLVRLLRTSNHKSLYISEPGLYHFATELE